MDAINDRLNAIADITDTLGAALENELALPGMEAEAPPSSAAGLVNLAEKTVRTIAENKASLAALQDSCARDTADLQSERLREEQAHLQRLARIDADLEAVRSYERRESEVLLRYIAAARGQLMELLA